MKFVDIELELLNGRMELPQFTYTLYTQSVICAFSGKQFARVLQLARYGSSKQQ